MDAWTLVCIMVIVVCIVLLVLVYAVKRRILRKSKKKLAAMAQGTKEMPVKEYLELREELRSGKRDEKSWQDAHITGVYVIYNKKKGKYLIGPSPDVMEEVNLLFSGYGCPQLYADYVRGNKFTVRAAALADSGVRSLSELTKTVRDKYLADAESYDMPVFPTQRVLFTGTEPVSNGEKEDFRKADGMPDGMSEIKHSEEKTDV